MRNKDEQRRAEQVEEYIDQKSEAAGELDPETREVVDSLQRMASETRPRPGFINELTNQLREQETRMSEKETGSFSGSFTRLLLGGVALAAMAVFVLYLTGLFGSPEIEPAVSQDDLPPRPLLEAEGSQHFADAEFRVMVPLGDEEEEINLYTAQQAPLPDSVADARTLGERFGLEAPTVYETPMDPGRWVVMGASGANISFRTGSAGLEGLYYSGPQPMAADGEPVAEADAEAAAITFLQGTGMLPENYQTQVEPTVSPVRNVRVIRLIDGHLLAGNQLQIEVGIGPDGNVVHARLNPTNIEAVGESVAVKSATQAFSELVEGSVTSVGYSFESMPLATGEQPQFFNPPPTEHEPGEQVDLAGWTNVLVPVAEGELQAILHARSGDVYYLQGPVIEELSESTSQQTLAVKGTITEQLGPQEWSLNVSEIESQMGAPVQCRSGQIIRDGDVTLETDEGERYSLAYPPAALQSGSRAEVCADEFDDQPVQWLHIASPPTREMARVGGGGGGSSVAVAVEEVQEVEVRNYEITLRHTESVDGEDRFFVYPLLGEPRLLEEIAEANRLHVRVIGEVIPGPEGRSGSHDQALVVQSFERVDLEEAIEVFLGYVVQEAVDRETMGTGGLQGTLIVERAVLGYKYEPSVPPPPVPAGEEPVGVAEPILLQPTWLFYGHTEDGNTAFTIEVPAADDTSGGRQ